MRKRALVLAAVVAGALSLAGCSDAAASGDTPSPAPTVTVSAPAPTVTVTAAPPARQPDDPVTALEAWTACTVAADQSYVRQNPGSSLIPFQASRDMPKDNGDGTFTATVGIHPPPGVAGGIIAVCTLGGTLGAPKLTDFFFKDI